MAERVYDRTTSEATQNALGPIRDAVVARMTKRGLGDYDFSPTGRVIRTQSVKRKHGIIEKIFGVPKSEDFYAWLTADWLITVAIDKKGVPMPLGHRLSDAELVDYESTSMMGMIEDNGVTVTAFTVGATQRSDYFVPLARSEVGDAFRQELRAAIAGSSVQID